MLHRQATIGDKFQQNHPDRALNLSGCSEAQSIGMCPQGSAKEWLSLHSRILEDTGNVAQCYPGTNFQCSWLLVHPGMLLALPGIGAEYSAQH